MIDCNAAVQLSRTTQNNQTQRPYTDPSLRRRPAISWSHDDTGHAPLCHPPPPPHQPEIRARLTAAAQEGLSDTTWTGGSPFRVKPSSPASGTRRRLLGAVHRCFALKKDRGPWGRGGEGRERGGRGVNLQVEWSCDFSGSP